MRIDPQLAALRSDKALQRRVQRRMDEATAQLSCSEWWYKVIAALEAYGAGVDLAALPVLSRLLSQADHAQEWLGQWVRSMASCLEESPFGQIPFRHSYSSGLTTMQLAAKGRAVLSLLVYERTDQERHAQSAMFVDREQLDLVVSGSATTDCLSCEVGSTDAIKSELRNVASGSTVDTSGPNLARQIRSVEECLVLLQLGRIPADPKPSREIQLSDGSLLRQSSGDKRASQHEMAMALLGAMGRKDAAPVMAAMSAKGPDHLRWEALRQSLHLDTAQGFAALSRLANDASDTLEISARALKHSLVHAHPELALLEDV